MLTKKLSSVVEEHALGTEPCQLGEDLVGSAVPDRAREHRRHRTELAVERTAPLRHERLHAHLLVTLDEAQVGSGELLELLLRATRSCRTVVELTLLVPPGQTSDVAERRSRLEAPYELHHRLLALAADEVGSVLQSFVGVEADVRAAEDDRNSRRGEQIGQPVGGRLRGGGRGDAGEVGAQALGEVDGRQHLTVDAHVMTALCEHPTYERKAEPRQEHEVVDVVPARARLDQPDAQAHGQLAGDPAAGSSTMG